MEVSGGGLGSERDLHQLLHYHTPDNAVVLLFPQLDPGKQYQYTPPTQPPIRPPYEQACHLRKNNLLSREDAVSSCPSQSGDEVESM